MGTTKNTDKDINVVTSEEMTLTHYKRPLDRLIKKFEDEGGIVIEDTVYATSNPLFEKGYILVDVVIENGVDDVDETETEFNSVMTKMTYTGYWDIKRVELVGGVGENYTFKLYLRPF